MACGNCPDWKLEVGRIILIVIAGAYKVTLKWSNIWAGDAVTIAIRLAKRRDITYRGLQNEQSVWQTTATLVTRSGKRCNAIEDTEKK
jgi:hypothetical protein